MHRQTRQPASIIPPLIFPVALMLVNAGGLQSSTELPGFPTDSFLAFALAVPFIQGALFATMGAGTELARDIQTGFLNRLSLTSLRGSALLFGHLALVGQDRGVGALLKPPFRAVSMTHSRKYTTVPATSAASDPPCHDR